MMFDNGDGTMTGGPLDVLLILHDVPKNMYHPAFFEESPMPGPTQDIEQMDFVRLKSKMHHTGGSPTWEGALVLMKDLKSKLEIPPENIFISAPFPWDGDIGIVYIAPNWVNTGVALTPEMIL